MNLGVYWYFGFPTGLYNFDDFEFKPGSGGHANNQAELITYVTTQNPEKLIGQLKSLIEKYQDGFLFVYRQNNDLQIGTGGYELTDYDFALIQEVELLLKNELVEFNKAQKFENAQLTRLLIENKKINTYPKNSFLQVVGSPLRKSNAQTKSLRFDCNISSVNKSNFINDLTELSKSVNISVFYYFDHDFSDRSNLMLFFTNGRQGINFQEKQYLDLPFFENKIEELLNKYHVQIGLERGYKLYPKNGPKIELVVDKEYVFD